MKEGVSVDNLTQWLSPLTNFLFTHAKEIYIFKPKVPGQADARISRLLPSQPFNSSPGGWANRLWHFPGFVSSTWARAQITGLGRPGFRGKGPPSQPGHLEVRQALIRGATPQRAPTIRRLCEVRCLKFSWLGQSQGSGLRDAALAGWELTQGYLHKFHPGC